MIHIAKHWNEAYDDSVIFKANLFNLIDSRYLIEKLESNSTDTQQNNNADINFSIEALNNSPFSCLMTTGSQNSNALIT